MRCPQILPTSLPMALFVILSWRPERGFREAAASPQPSRENACPRRAGRNRSPRPSRRCSQPSRGATKPARAQEGLRRGARALDEMVASAASCRLFLAAPILSRKSCRHFSTSFCRSLIAVGAGLVRTTSSTVSVKSTANSIKSVGQMSSAPYSGTSSSAISCMTHSTAVASSWGQVQTRV